MKKILAVVMAFLVGFSVSGCRKSEVTSPEKLISKPIYSEEKNKIYEKIDIMIDASSTLLLPSNSSQVGKINMVDLIGQKKREILAFIKNERIGDTNQVGFIVFDYDEDKNLKKIFQTLTNGESIDYADFIDIDNDGKKEIVTLVRNSTDFELSLYGEDKKDKSFKKLSSINIEDSDVKIKVVKNPQSEEYRIIMISGVKDYKASLSLVTFTKDKKMQSSEATVIENIKNIRDVNLYYGKVNNTTRAYIIDYPLQNDAYVATQVYSYVNNQLTPLFSDSSKYLIKPYSLEIKDINDDGIYEFPNVDKAITTQLSDTGDRYYSSMVNWYQWNSKTGSFFDMDLVSKIYTNYNYNFSLNIPKDMASKIFIKQRDESDISLFDIYYIDEIDATKKKLYSIIVKPVTTADESNSKSDFKDAYSLAKSNDYVYGIIVNNKMMTDRLDFDISRLRENFRLIYK